MTSDTEFSILVYYKDTITDKFFAIPFETDSQSFLFFKEDPKKAAMRWFELSWHFHSDLFLDRNHVEFDSYEMEIIPTRTTYN